MKSESMLLFCAIVALIFGFRYDVSIEATMIACSACIIRALKEGK